MTARHASQPELGVMVPACQVICAAAAAASQNEVFEVPPKQYIVHAEGLQNVIMPVLTLLAEPSLTWTTRASRQA